METFNYPPDMPPARVLIADPAWPFGDALPGKGRGAVSHYPLMSIEEIFAVNLPPLADDATVMLWRVASMVEQAYDTLRVWGFKPKCELVWLKMTKNGKPWFGMGHYFRGAHETCIVATRGKPRPKVRNLRTVFPAKVGRHSEKPDEFYRLVEQYSDGPYVELFARRRRPGWFCFGNELGAE